MAIVETYHGSRGGTVHIADDVLKTLTKEELKANQEHFYDVARGIFERAAIRELQKKKASEE